MANADELVNGVDVADALGADLEQDFELGSCFVGVITTRTNTHLVLPEHML